MISMGAKVALCTAFDRSGCFLVLPAISWHKLEIKSYEVVFIHPGIPGVICNFCCVLMSIRLSLRVPPSSLKTYEKFNLKGFFL